MPLTDPALWAKIDAYPLPQDSQGRGFTDQLRAEHGLSATTATRAVTEYKRFLYLCATGDGRSVPTKAVDAVWHHHLSHSRDYWDGFVPRVLGGRAIHHSPGQPDGHRRDFRATLKRYEAEFGETPPKGIWKRSNPYAQLPLAAVAAVFLALWVMGGVQGDISGLPFLLGVALAGSFIFLGIGPLLQQAGFSVGFEIDIFADGEGGDCGDCGGGCGD